jgi:hypothetical protein
MIIIKTENQIKSNIDMNVIFCLFNFYSTILKNTFFNQEILNEHFNYFHGSFYLNAYSKEFDKIDGNYIGRMDQKCNYCDSFNFSCEAVGSEFTACCNKETIILPPLISLPYKIKNLFTGIKIIKSFKNL